MADGRAADASLLLSEALALFRGPRLADFAFDPWAQGPIARIDELRRMWLEAKFAADVELGRHGGEEPAGGMSVREPRRPRPIAPAAGALAPEPPPPDEPLDARADAR